MEEINFDFLSQQTKSDINYQQESSEMNIFIRGGQQFGLIEAELLSTEIKKYRLNALDFQISENNNFCPKSVEIIGESISQFKELRRLSLSLYDNKFDSDGALFLGDALSSLENVETLKLVIGHQNQFGAYGVSGLLNALKNMKKLNSLFLNMGENKIGQYGAKCIGNSLVELTHLNSLFLTIERNNNIGSGGAIGLGSGISSLYQLKELSLVIGFNNSIGPEGMKAICTGITSVQNLVKLSISIGQNNNIKSEGAQALAQAFQKLKNLNIFDLVYYENNIGPSGFQEIGEKMGFLKNLVVLSISIGTNNMSSEGAIGIGHGLKNLDQLSSLSLKIGFNNEIGPIGAQGLAWGIQYLNNLTSLQLEISGGNKIENDGAKELGKSIQFLRKLTNLSMKFGSNNIRSGLETLFKNIQYLSNLQNFEILVDRKNTVQLSEVKELSKSLKQLLCLTHLNIGITDPLSLYLITLLKEKEISPQNLSIKYLTHFKYVNRVINEEDKEDFTEHSLELSVYIGIGKYMGQSSSIGFVEGLKHFNTITNLTLSIGSNNTIDQEGASQLGSCLQTLVNLRKLNLHIGMFNSIEQDGCSKIGNSLKHLTQLIDLRLWIGSQSRIKSKGFRSLVEGFSSHSKQLKILQFRVDNGNDFATADVEYLSDELKSFSLLTKLSLELIDYQHVYDSKSIILLGNSISYLTQLRGLVFNLNQWGMFDPNQSFEMCRFVFNLPFLRYLQIEVPSQFKKYTKYLILRCKRLVVLK